MKQIIISTLIATIILFLWSGVTQMLPWGVPSAQNVNAQTNEVTTQTETPNVIRIEPNSLTTDKFESQFLGKISIYSTDNTYSWIVTNPVKSDYSGYFIKEFITQLLVGLLLSIILSLTVSLNMQRRLGLIVLTSICAITGTYGQLMNWWELPASYGLGVGLNLLIGWFLASFILIKFFIKSEHNEAES